MTSGGLSPENTAQEAALDDDAAPTTGSEPDTASQSPSDPDASSPAVAAEPAGDVRTVLDGPALENEEMRGATEELRSSEVKAAQAREIAKDLVAETEPDRQD